MSQQQIQIIHARKRTRGELRLPQLHFIATDNWIPTIGERAFCAWLTFFSWADRSVSERDFDAVPRSMKSIQKKLGVAPATFYNTVVRPLWNYGFIDLIEHEGNGTSTTINIVVYEYPNNDTERAIKPLEKIRDYDTEYESKGKARITNAYEKSCSKIEQGNIDVSSSKIEQAPSSKIEQETKKSCSKIEQNNVLNNSFNVSNNNNNTEPENSVVVVYEKLKLAKIKTSKRSVETLLNQANGNIEYILRLVDYASDNELGFGWIKTSVANGDDVELVQSSSGDGFASQTSQAAHAVQKSKYDVFYQYYNQT